MHPDHLDQKDPPAIVSHWIAPKLEIRAEVLNHLKNLAEAIRMEIRWYDDNDAEVYEQARVLQIKLVNWVETFSITEYELEKFIETLEDNDVLKGTLRMLYGDKLELIAALKVYKDDIDTLLQSENPELKRLLSLTKKKDEMCGPPHISKELEEKLKKARERTDLIVGPSLYPMDDLLAQYTIPHSPPSPEQSEHWVPLHIPEEVPSQLEIWNHWWSSLWRRLLKFPWI